MRRTAAGQPRSAATAATAAPAAAAAPTAAAAAAAAAATDRSPVAWQLKRATEQLEAFSLAVLAITTGTAHFVIGDDGSLQPSATVSPVVERLAELAKTAHRLGAALAERQSEVALLAQAALAGAPTDNDAASRWGQGVAVAAEGLAAAATPLVALAREVDGGGAPLAQLGSTAAALASAASTAANAARTADGQVGPAIVEAGRALAQAAAQLVRSAMRGHRSGRRACSLGRRRRLPVRVRPPSLRRPRWSSGSRACRPRRSSRAAACRWASPPSRRPSWNSVCACAASTPPSRRRPTRFGRARMGEPWRPDPPRRS